MVQSIGNSIWQIRAANSGTSLCLLGGIHGNEKTGIEVVKLLQKEFGNGARQLYAGTLTLALGNLEAIAQEARFIEGRDLNRYFTDTQLLGIGDGSIEQTRAQKLAKIIASADITVDLHATNKASQPFICSKADTAHEQIYRWFGADIVLSDPRHILAGEPATTDEYADRMGKVGVCIETGNANDTSKVSGVLASAQALMADLGMLESAPPVVPQAPHKVYSLAEAVLLDERGFRFAEGRGLGSFEPVLAGDVIGYKGDEAIQVDYNGVIVFPKVPEHHFMGKPVCYLAVENNTL